MLPSTYSKRTSAQKRLYMQNMITILGLIVNIRGGTWDGVTLYDHLMSTHNITKQSCALKVQPWDATSSI